MSKGFVLESLLSMLTGISSRQKDEQFRLSIVELQDPGTFKKLHELSKNKEKGGRRERKERRN